MALTLNLIKANTDALHLDHQTWIEENIKGTALEQSFKARKTKAISYDMLSVFYSSSRFGETSLTQEGNPGEPCARLLFDLIKKSKKKYKKDKEELAKIAEFEKQYGKFLKIFVEKS